MAQHLESHIKDLYLLRYSAMCKPAGEVANLTQLESHTTRARTMIMWRVAAGQIRWNEREAELMYQATLDSISEAFDIFHYPISRYMLDGRAEIWEAGCAPDIVKEVVAQTVDTPFMQAPHAETLILAGEAVQISDETWINKLASASKLASQTGGIWRVHTGATAYCLGARAEARRQAEQVLSGIRASGASLVIADGPETAWALLKIYPDLGLQLPGEIKVRLLCEELTGTITPESRLAGKAFVHDSRPAYFLADSQPKHQVVLPGYNQNETAFGTGPVFDMPRRLVQSLGIETVRGTWVRGLAKSCGADDGLWLTYPDLAAGLAVQRLDYAKYLKAERIITDSPLCANWLANHWRPGDPQINWLPELLLDQEG